MRWGHSYRVIGLPRGIAIHFSDGPGGDGRQRTGGRRGGGRGRSRAQGQAQADHRGGRRAAILGGGAATWFLFFRHHGEGNACRGAAAEAAVVRRGAGHAGQPGRRARRARAVPQGQGRARGQGREAGRGDQADDAARHRYLPDLSARTAAERPQRFRGTVSPQGRIDPAGQCRGRANQVSAVLFKEIVVQ